MAEYLGPIQTAAVPLFSAQAEGPIQFATVPVISAQFLGPIQFSSVPIIPSQFLGPTQFADVAIISAVSLGPVQFASAPLISTQSLGPVQFANISVFGPPRPRQLVSGRSYTEVNQDAAFRITARTSINLLQPGAQLLVAIGGIGRMIIESVLLEITSGTGITADATVVLVTGAGDTLLGSTTLTNFRNTGNVVALRPSGAGVFIETEGALYLEVVSPATGTTLTAQAHVIAALIP